MFYSTGGDSRSVDKLSIRGQRAEGTREHGHNGDNEIGRPMAVDRVGDRTSRNKPIPAPTPIAARTPKHPGPCNTWGLVHRRATRVSSKEIANVLYLVERPLGGKSGLPDFQMHAPICGRR